MDTQTEKVKPQAQSMPMKPTVPSFFFYLAFTLSLSTALGLSIASADVEPVLDSEGNPVSNGGLYLLIQAAGESGGGIQTAALNDETCPISVVHAITSLGQPLYIRISSTNNDDYVYPTNSSDIIFQYTPPCTNSSKLIVKNFAAVPTVFIGDEDESTVAGDFHIQKHESFYKFVFCPDIIPGTCWDIGFSPSGDGRLVKNQEEPFQFIIWRLESSASII